MLPDRRRGSALIEVLVALVVLAVGGVALVALLGQTTRTMRSVRDTERETLAASEILDRFAAMDRAGLVSMLGRRAAGGLSAQVVEKTPDLFEASVGRSDTSVALLRTTFYRPDSLRDAR